MDAAVIPLPSEETTPPVMKMNLDMQRPYYEAGGPTFEREDKLTNSRC